MMKTDKKLGPRGEGSGRRGASILTGIHQFLFVFICG
jgi:hypothetical protein